MQRQRVPAKSLRVGGLGELLNAQNIALQVRPTKLRQPFVIFEIRAETVAAQDAREHRPQQMYQYSGTARLGHRVENEIAGHQRPSEDGGLEELVEFFWRAAS